MKIFDEEITIGDVLVFFFVLIMLFIEAVQFMFWLLRFLIEVV